ncbi:MAG: GvpL/GvpF family gas vesicle protein [Candidatus Marinimicrobia bacterium]|nr:GvpL/GvpF family gas vesicle protein [Candidatus Neomarinimicrobiota bacterium]
MATSTGYYIYGFTNCNGLVDTATKAIGGVSIVQNIPLYGIGVLCSPVNGKELLYRTRDNMGAHQVVLESWIKKYDVLPARFGQVAQSKGALYNGVRSALPIIRSEFQHYKGKREMNLKAFWVKEFIYDHIQKKYPKIERFKEQIKKMKGPNVHYKCIEIGQLVERTLLAESEAEAELIVKEISPIALQYKKNKTFGELMFLNMAILVNNEKLNGLDNLVNHIAEKQEGKAVFKYFGPNAPGSFVNIHLKF